MHYLFIARSHLRVEVGPDAACESRRLPAGRWSGIPVHAGTPASQRTTLEASLTLLRPLVANYSPVTGHGLLCRTGKKETPETTPQP